MMFDEFMVNTVQVETLQGVNGAGQFVYSAPVTVTCFRDDARKFARDKTGDQVVSETTLHTALADGSLFLEGSRVTLLAGDGMPSRVTTVIKVSLFDSGLLGLPDHAEVSLK